MVQLAFRWSLGITCCFQRSLGESSKKSEVRVRTSAGHVAQTCLFIRTTYQKHLLECWAAPEISTFYFFFPLVCGFSGRQVWEILISVQMEILDWFCHQHCISYFSIAGLKRLDQGKLQKKEFAWTYSSRGKSVRHHHNDKA